MLPRPIDLYPQGTSECTAPDRAAPEDRCHGLVEPCEAPRHNFLKAARHELAQQERDDLDEERGGEAEPSAREVADERERGARADSLAESKQTPRGDAADGGLDARRHAAGDDAARAEADGAQERGHDDWRECGANCSHTAGGDERFLILLHPPS
jgi:hypothetical protein